MRALAAGAFVVALLASPLLAVYEILLGLVVAALATAASVALRHPVLRGVAAVGMAVAAGGLVYVAAGLALNP